MSKKHKPLKLSGKVVAFNLSPKGHIEGALVETSAGNAQINFPKHDADAVARTLRVGAKIDVEGELETEKGDHPVYRLIDHRPEARGTIERLNYALHGEVNGYHLRDGTFVHVKPGGAKKYKLGIGDEIKASGSRRSGGDAVVLEADGVKRLGKAGGTKGDEKRSARRGKRDRGESRTKGTAV